MKNNINKLYKKEGITWKWEEGIEKAYSNKDGKIMHGHYRHYHDGGTINQIGTWINGLKEGAWQTFYENGNKHMVGQIKDIQEEGTWECYYSDGSLRFRGEYKNGVGEGPWEFYFSNGNANSNCCDSSFKWSN